MRYWYIAAGILAVLLLLWLIWVLCYRHRARCLVRRRTDEEKCRDLNRALSMFGFGYDLCQDIFYSLKDARQRKTGYGRIYDEHAISMNMVLDCEPIYFAYDGRRFLLELWKGQYGIATGAEIGLYVSDEETEEQPERLFYRSVSDEEMIPMRFVLRKHGRILTIRDEVHWWLTGFVLGEFSNPDELGMEVAVVFPNVQMQHAFYEALLQAGYHKDNVCVSGRKVSFSFTKPHTRQPKHWKLRVRMVQQMNRRNCRRYLRVTKPFVRTIDRVDYLGMCFPVLYRMLGRMSRLPSPKRCGRIQKKCKRNKE